MIKLHVIRLFYGVVEMAVIVSPAEHIEVAPVEKAPANRAAGPCEAPDLSVESLFALRPENVRVEFKATLNSSQQSLE